MYVQIYISLSLSLSLYRSVNLFLGPVSMSHDLVVARPWAAVKPSPSHHHFLWVVWLPFPTGCFVPRFYSEIRDGLWLFFQPLYHGLPYETWKTPTKAALGKLKPENTTGTGFHLTPQQLGPILRTNQALSVVTDLCRHLWHQSTSSHEAFRHASQGFLVLDQFF